MYKPAVRIILKLLELIGCVACVITKQLTDLEARRIALTNQKFSREWTLLNNVTWSREGNAFANITYGGYTLIIGLLLISRCINARSRPTITDKIFLIVGVLFFFVLGGLVYASIEQVPPDLFDNAIILGSLSFFVGFLLIIDLGDPSKHFKSSQTQTERPHNNQTSTQTTSYIDASSPSMSNNEFKQLNIPNLANDINLVGHSTSTTLEPQIIPPSNGYYFSGEKVDIVRTKELPKSQEPVFTKITTLPVEGGYGIAVLPKQSRIKKIRQNRKEYDYEDNYSNYIHAPSSANYNHNSAHCSKHNFEITEDDDNLDRPIKPGFVAQAARMWDRKAKVGSFAERSTIV